MFNKNEDLYSFMERTLNKMLDNNIINVINGNHCGYDGGYAEGVHDTIIDIMNALGIPHDEDFCN